MTLSELNDMLVRRLSDALGAGEGRATARLLMEDVVGADPVRIFTRGQLSLEPETVAVVSAMADRIVAGEPPQYVVGRARFMGLDIEVTRDTLIPRPETAGLVDMITDDYAGCTGLSVLDVGTGSGCIALALGRALVFADIDGIDISAAAVDVARRNAARLHVKARFEVCDILRAAVPESPSYDIIVSNPPYIALSERKDMDRSVTEYEPASALYVLDDNPLEFYEAIARYGIGALKGGGRIYFEINPVYSAELRALMTGLGYADAEVYRDYLGRERYMRAIRTLS